MCPADWRIEQVTWNVPVRVSDSNWIIVKIHPADGTDSHYCIAYYGHLGVREQTIEDLRAISEYTQAIEDRVIIGGDFNLSEDAVVTMFVVGFTATGLGQASVDLENGCRKKGVKFLQSRIFKNTNFEKGRIKGVFTSTDFGGGLPAYRLQGCSSWCGALQGSIKKRLKLGAFC